MKRPLNRVERMRSILRSLGLKPALSYAVAHGISCEAAIVVVRENAHA